MEMIGKVRIEDEFYSGRDLYADGGEDMLLEIVKAHPASEYEQIIKEKKDWAVLYHLSENRGNIVDWMENDKGASVLEVGAGCGAVTGKLAEKYGKVTCVELSRKRSLVNAYRHQEKDNIEIKLGNYKDISVSLEEKYDIITLIGVFEYAAGYMGTENPYEDFLISLKQHLKPDGKILIAIENQFGLKYWAGCVEDHRQTLYEGLEGYWNIRNVRTFTKEGLERVVKRSGCTIEKFYYPYPDYKFPLSIYSDDYLPRIGELNNNFNNFDASRLVTFDESKVFDTIIEENKFPEFSNSFFIVVKEGTDQ